MLKVTYILSRVASQLWFVHKEWKRKARWMYTHKRRKQTRGSNDSWRVVREKKTATLRTSKN